MGTGLFSRALALVSVFTLMVLASPARAWDEWAYSLITYSSQYSPTNGSGQQVLDLPDVTTYGDASNAWTPANQDGTTEYITVGFLEPLYATGATIRENYGNGSVIKVEAQDLSGVYHTVWFSTDPSLPGSVVDFKPTWTKTSYLVQALRVVINTNHSSSWEEIDAIGMTGDAVAPLQWASSVLGFSSEYNASPGDWSSARALGIPDVVGYGDNHNAWAPGNQDGTTETITLGFATVAAATGVTVRETFGNGYVTKVETLDTGNAYHTVWTGIDLSQPAAPAWFTATWSQTAYSVKGVRITINTDTTTGWEEIDAVYLHGPQATAPPPTISSLNPDFAYREGPAFTLSVNGTGFVSNSVVRWNGSDRPTTFVSATRLTAQITAADITTPGSQSVTVNSPSPGGGLSAVKAFSVSTDLGQWANVVIGYSTQYNPMPYGYSASSALGAPDVFVLHDNSNAWTPGSMDMGLQYLTLGYARAVQADGVVIRETTAPGFVTQVDLLDVNGVYHTVWTGTDTSSPGGISDFSISFTKTSYLVWGVRVWVDTNHTLADWEEIDAVQLIGLPPTVPAPAITGFGRSPLLKGGPAFTMVVTGTAFQPNTVLRWGGSDRTTAFLSPTQVALSLTAADVASTGTVALTAYTPPPGGGTSSAANISVGPSLWGDVNGSGALDLTDATQALRAAAGINKPASPSAGDIWPEYPDVSAYGDGRVSIGDAIRVLQRVRGLR